MKKNYVQLIIAILFATNVMAQNVPNYVPSNGLVGWWPFNGNANDESGNGNHGTVNGATLTSDRNNQINNAQKFNINSNAITCNSANLQSQNFTISLWFKLNSTFSYTSLNLFKIGPNDASTYGGCGLRIDQNDQVCGAGKYQVYGFVSSKSNFTTINQTSPYTEFNELNNWNHYIFIKNNNTLSIYLNNKLLLTQNINKITIDFTNSLLQIGNQQNINNNVIGERIIDDIAYFNRALDEKEITGLYTSTPTCTNPNASITPQSTTTFCQGGSVNLNASTGANYTYEWYNNGNIINGATSSIYNASTSGNYTVKVIDGACNTTSSATAVTVNANPTVSLNSINAYTLKTSSPIQLVGNPTGGSYGGEGVIGSSFNPATLKLGKKTITYNYTSPQGCSGSASKTTIVADTVGNVCSVTKYDTVKVINTITKYDTITTKITINDTVSILKIHFQLTTGIKANTVTHITVYPNPTSDVLIIDAIDSPALAGYTYRILDIQGKQIYNAPVTSSKTEIALKTLGAKGVYVLHIVDSNGISIENKKIVLQ